MAHIEIHSRPGNVSLALAGALIAVAALITLGMFMSTTWQGSSLMERVMQIGLIGVAGAGGYFVWIAAANLGIDRRLLRRH
jgi:hypothetical protein